MHFIILVLLSCVMLNFSCGVQKEDRATSSSPIELGDVFIDSGHEGDKLRDYGDDAITAQPLVKELYFTGNEPILGCFESVFNTTLTRTNDPHQEEIFNVSNWSSNVCITIIYDKMTSAHFVLDDIDVWKEQDFNNSFPKIQKSLTKIIALSPPFKGSLLKIRLHGQPGNTVIIDIQTALPINTVETGVHSFTSGGLSAEP